ncbi:hypothetical protein FHW67_000442 [Herbaspirillum sp. Sphag1AN]|uniref:hypothetical protein n=1 Tax=unclassified Herbaspirillum TaxID=2624150 RepID=UPI0016170A07|nr:MULTISPECIES: hypothetical protein [unclassified Herbaspirillum]MBB3211207.1 hypothetical protein [Herbaspirillum sp. Sphag1AN]MBB3244836.1 hypothetical protein [Herbaspirillum sp. Sphag64]
MKTSSDARSADTFQLSNLHVILILLVAGTLLIIGTWIVAGEFGKVPVSLWDICTTAINDVTGKAAAPINAPVLPPVVENNR